jgi:hypothetical protein
MRGNAHDAFLTELSRQMKGRGELPVCLRLVSELAAEFGRGF